MSRSAFIQVPASTSNIGGGFDCVGIAIDLWLRVAATLDAAARVTPANRLHQGFTAACRAAGRRPPAVRFDVESAIPIGRGLGSSAAAAVAGAQAANALLELGLDHAALLTLCAGIEGHADNVAPALTGGATLVTRRTSGYAVTPLVVHADIAFVFAVPDFVLETRRARSVLPEFVPHAVAAGAAARAAALVQGLAHADSGLLALGLDDVLHVPFRKRFIPGYTGVTSAARAAGAWGATLSGSGSSILALAPHDAAAAVTRNMARAWDALGVHADVIQPSIVREVVCQ